MTCHILTPVSNVYESKHYCHVIIEPCDTITYLMIHRNGWNSQSQDCSMLVPCHLILRFKNKSHFFHTFQTIPTKLLDKYTNHICGVKYRLWPTCKAFYDTLNIPPYGEKLKQYSSYGFDPISVKLYKDIGNYCKYWLFFLAVEQVLKMQYIVILTWESIYGDMLIS